MINPAIFDPWPVLRQYIAKPAKAPAAEIDEEAIIDAALLAEASWSAVLSPTCYVCGPTSFVERVAELLTASGHSAERIRTERFGPTENRG